ncbi:MAG TPA: AAA family ATPase, partial [Spirochaetales bacterium]|nr:AAA family ATPase [Spirochaetales bacterium]
DARNVKSPKYYVTLLRDALRGDDNWAGRDREINNRRQNTIVRDDMYKQFVTLKPSKPKTELIADYKEKLKEFENAKTGASTIDAIVPTIQNSYSTYDDETVQQLLVKEIEKPKLSEREKKLLTLVQRGKVDELNQRLEVFQKKETVECPYCFQPVTPGHKESLIESIEKVLNQAVKYHQEELQSHILDQIIINLEPYEKLEDYQTCVDLINKINATIQGNNEKLKKKITNPYESIVTNTISVKTLVTQLITALEDLEKARVEYNKAVTKTDPIIKELNRINSEIAHYDVIDLSTQLDKQQNEYIVVETLYCELKVAYEEKKKVVEDYEAQRKNIRIAVDAINACMKYIFFADDRLKIEYVDGVYKLLSNGKSVRPCDVSAGERNIIGLSYFFTNILEDKEEKDAYSEDYILVIDDPVSSFDAENRIGILSFLKYKLSMFLEGDSNTKALVMTHDLMTYYDIHKIFEEIINVCKKKGYPQEPKFNCFEIRKGGLKTFCYKTRQEYTELITIVYTYALGQVNDYEIVIGNMMRQVLEAFSTFEYKKSIEAVSTDAQILGLLPDTKYVSYYKNLMYRLVLHGGSHREEQIKAMKDFQFFSLISETEKKRTAKDVLCFIYMLNKRHLLEHLKECGNVETELQSWCQDIKARAAII